MSTRRKIQLLLWAYFWLLILEGALRKWFLPGLSTPLLMVRDPIALLAVFWGLPYLTRGPWRTWCATLWIVGGLAFILAVTLGHGDVPTALFGARILWIHLPLAFLFPAVFGATDLWRFAKWTLIVAIPMTVLLAMQYTLPQSHFLNVAPGGEGSAGFGGALGKFRPPGTFSFINGVTHFYAIATALFVAWMLSGPRPLPKWIWVAASGLVFALPLSISRTLLFNYVFTGGLAVIASVRSGRAIRNVLVGAVVISVLVAVMSRVALFQDAQRAFEARWDDATEVEGGDAGVAGVLDKRVGRGTVGSLSDLMKVPVEGKGIGLGTNLGATRFSGRRAFLVAEATWPATIGELGPILGVVMLSWRVMLSLKILGMAWRSAVARNPVPMILASAALPNLIVVSTAQPTGLGFIVVSIGFFLMALRPASFSPNRPRQGVAWPKTVGMQGPSFQRP